MKRKKWMDRIFYALVLGFTALALGFADPTHDIPIIISGIVVIAFGLINLILDKNAI